MAQAKKNPIQSLFSIYTTEIRIMMLGLGIIMLFIILLTVTGFIKTRTAAFFITDVFSLITDLLALVLGLIAIFFLIILDVIDFIWNVFAVIMNTVVSWFQQLLGEEPPVKPDIDVGLFPLHLFDVDVLKTQMALDLRVLIDTLRNIAINFVLDTSDQIDRTLDGGNGGNGESACDQYNRENPHANIRCD